MNIKGLDLAIQYKGIRGEILKAVEKVCDSQAYILAENVRGLEAEIAKYCNAKYAVGVASGTDALLLALMALGVGRDDKVITTPYTFFSTASAITRLGAVPVFVDIDPDTYNIDTDALEGCLKKNRGVKVVMPVHLYGQSAEMGAINRMTKKYGAKVVEDAAQAIGARYKGKRAGSLGDIGCFSFYPTKNLGGFGDGGMVTTNNKKIADSLAMLRVHGSKDRYHHKVVGINSRLDELQAAVLRIKLKHLDKWSKARVNNAKRYERLFKKAGLEGVVKRPYIADYNESVFNQYVVSVNKRDKLKEFLAANGVASAIYYPVPLHLQDCFKYLGYKKGDMPVSENAAKTTLALPMYPELKAAEQEYVVEQIAKFFL